MKSFLRIPHQKSIFLASEYLELNNIWRQVEAKLKNFGWRVVKGADARTRGEMRYERHDVCLQRIDRTPYFLVLIGRLAGSSFRGKQPKYRKYSGLLTTHAEIRRSILKKPPGKWFCFVHHEVLIAWELWKKNGYRKKFRCEPIDKRVFRWITEIKKHGRDTYPFDEWEDLEGQLKRYLASEIKGLKRRRTV